MDFIHIQDRGLFSVKDRFHVHGVNLGNWLNLEDFMFGIPGVNWRIKEAFSDALGRESAEKFFSEYEKCYFTAEDADFLSKKGFNVVRLPLNYRAFESDMEPRVYRKSAFRTIDRAVELGRTYGLRILLDLHAAPGSQSEDVHSDNAGTVPMFFEVLDFMDRAVDLWSAIARRYAAEPAVLGYDLLNEPQTRHPDRLNDYYQKAIRAIRKVDVNHFIMVEGNRWSDEIEALLPSLFEDPQVMAEYHHYPYFQAKKYPGILDGKKIGKAAMRDTMRNKFEFFGRVERPLLLGEFGLNYRFSTDASHAVMEDLLSLNGELSGDWAIWSYKDVGAMGLVSPRKDTPWMKFLDGPEIKKALKRDDTLWDTVKRGLKPFSTVPQTVRSRGTKMFYRGYQEIILHFILERLKNDHAADIEGLARSFSFQSCMVHEGTLDVLRKHIC